MNLPDYQSLPINLLAACFNKTSATYKFYWFLSIINQVEHGKITIQKHELFADMIAQSWFTVNYFHVSFGKQDKLQQAIENLKTIEGLTIDAPRQMILETLSTSKNKGSIHELQYFNSEVPHRFLSPWFKADDLKEAYHLSKTFTNCCLYALSKDQIQINPAWIEYLRTNARVLKDFCYWNLAMYLQAKNPNVPDIPNKLIKLPVRKALVEQRRNFWDIVIRELGSVDCIYTNKKLVFGDYAVEHFVPYAFVSHDLIWNLIPADRSFNSSKSDRLPILDKHFLPFFKLQKEAVDIIRYKSPKNRFLEDYLTLFPALSPHYFTQERFFDQVQPLITIASNNGFQFML
ncbi:HNH endonuclease domain-containing protein [Mucilaginibacter sp.]|jgi:hypothetical protein|uniref:HNH endonuclease domain-containing protein n=1 Tax=Mucilaginibacter sp. TaxID=1882438 RepID=UPI002C2DAD4B|nr:HNH endonuclease domain-containing protein [Mucilaginibacter sp.]HTI60386.1 HNH endonuclease domain-containing protein [Mucilaginibacter sp.]